MKFLLSFSSLKSINTIIIVFFTTSFLSVLYAREPSDDLLVGTRELPPFAMKDQDGNWKGITIDLWNEIAKELKLSFKYKKFTLEYLLSGIENETIDVGAAALSITSERERVMDFTHSFFITGLGIAVKNKKGPSLWNALSGFFSSQFLKVIATLALILLIFGFMVWLFERKHNPSHFGGKAINGIGAGFWWSAVTLTTVGYGDKAPVTLGGRFVALIWMFTGIIIISTITASITSALTLASLQTGIEGPQDLSRLNTGTIPNSTSSKYLSQKGITPRLFQTLDEALIALDKGTIEAIVYDSPVLTYSINRDFPGKLSVLPYTFEQQRYGIAVPFNNPLRQSINRVLLELTENGKLKKIKQRYLGDSIND